MYTYSTLENTPVEVIHQVFMEAYANYPVSLNLSLAGFKYLLQRRGYVPELSWGVFADSELVGFILNGLRIWQGKTTAYDITTGVKPAHRKRGLNGQLFWRVKDILDVDQYVLEVLRENTTALEIYKSEGFKVRRELSCFWLDKAKFQATAPPHHIELTETFAPVEAFWDFHPSWQNSTDSLNAVPGAFVYAMALAEDNIIGYGVVDKTTGDIPQLAVRQNYRRQGVGTSIMQALLNATEADKLGVLNVDDDYPTMAEFLRGVGFEFLAGQYELVLHGWSVW